MIIKHTLPAELEAILNREYMKIEYVTRGRKYPEDAVSPALFPVPKTTPGIAEACAEWHFTEGGFPEENWPMTFSIYLDGVFSGKYIVDRCVRVEYVCKTEE